MARKRTISATSSCEASSRTNTSDGMLASVTITLPFVVSGLNTNWLMYPATNGATLEAVTGKRGSNVGRNQHGCWGSITHVEGARAAVRSPILHPCRCALALRCCPKVRRGAHSAAVMFTRSACAQLDGPGIEATDIAAPLAHKEKLSLLARDEVYLPPPSSRSAAADALPTECPTKFCSRLDQRVRLATREGLFDIK